MNPDFKPAAKKAIHFTKKTAASNRHTRRAAQKIKRVLISALGSSGHQELYNLADFYPSITEYYWQQHDVPQKSDPLISILLPTYNTPEVFLRECIESIIVQSYGKWELCIADDNSPSKEVVDIIKEYQKADTRIKLIERKQNGHISEATNSALELATGDFIALMDHDDVLWPNALYEMVKIIRNDNKVDFIYSDEDKIDGTGKIHSYPFLKPDFSPEFLESCNYITHFSCIRTNIMKKVGGFRKGYEGAQDWDLFIRISEITNNIVHIPKLLYSWRIHEASTASDTDAKPYVYEAQKKLLDDHLARTGRKGVVETGIIRQHRTIKYEPAENTSLTVVIRFSSAKNFECLARSMHAYRPGLDYELLITYPKTLKREAHGALKFLGSNVDASIVEESALKSSLKTAKETILLKDTVEIITDNWARVLTADLQTEGVMAVGPVLLDQDRLTVKSAGLGLGYGDGIVNMLEGTPLDDPHYTRGLYAKSRRNVTALNPAVIAMYAFNLPKLITDQSLIGLFLKESTHNRLVYTPYVQIVLHGNGKVSGVDGTDGYIDTMLNPNFDQSNQCMEVRSN